MINTPHVRKLVRLALEEDLGAGDITSALTIPAQHVSQAQIIARENLILCGQSIISVVLEEMRSSLELTPLAQDGAWLNDGAVIAKLSGLTREILSAERTLLNFLQRLSGVATRTAAFVKAAQGIVVLDTRKTMPGWRALEKYAVRIGGGVNHRGSLGDMVLIKNNHIDACGKSIDAILQEVKRAKPLYMKVEVEVRTLGELSAALRGDPDVVMLDNMPDEEIKKALSLVSKAARPPLVEISGGIRTERLAALKNIGVTLVSCGSLTTQATNVDISLRILA